MCAAAVAGSLMAIRSNDPALAQRVRLLVPSQADAKVSLMQRIGRRLPGDRDRLEGDALKAGLTVDADSLLALRWAAAAVGSVGGLLAGPLAILASPALALSGWRALDVYLSRRVRSRRAEMQAALPDAAELLAVCVQGGLNISLALRRVADAVPGTLGSELRRMQDEIELGKPRGDAFGDLAARHDQKDLSALMSLVVQADRLGSGIADALDSAADEMRRRARLDAEERARKAPVKMLFPLVILILPAFIMLTIVPLLLGTFQTLGF